MFCLANYASASSQVAAADSSPTKRAPLGRALLAGNLLPARVRPRSDPKTAAAEGEIRAFLTAGEGEHSVPAEPSTVRVPLAAGPGRVCSHVSTPTVRSVHSALIWARPLARSTGLQAQVRGDDAPHPRNQEALRRGAPRALPHALLAASGSNPAADRPGRPDACAPPAADLRPAPPLAADCRALPAARRGEPHGLRPAAAEHGAAPRRRRSAPGASARPAGAPPSAF